MGVLQGHKRNLGSITMPAASSFILRGAEAGRTEAGDVAYDHLGRQSKCLIFLIFLEHLYVAHFQFATPPEATIPSEVR